MTYNFFDHLCGTVAVILFIWTSVLVWATWQIHRMLQTLINERREMRRWKRLQGIYERQRTPWE